MKPIGWSLFGLVVIVTLAGAVDDGPLFERNISKTPELSTDHAAIKMMQAYVPAQNSKGASVVIKYLIGDDCTYKKNEQNCPEAYTRDQARPLVATYTDGEVTFIDAIGFSGHGRRDAYAALSLDDGATWKKYNLSRSGDRSSFALKDGTAYPGDVIGIASAVAGPKVLVAWASRYCRGGNPGYLDLEMSEDLFGVSGSQQSSDFADEGYPEVGEVPYACLWTALGILDETDGVYGIAWQAAERVTSGVRDVNQIQVAAAKEAGFVITWQEDPDGLRPGKGFGPGEGWSGAIAHQKTDIWYTYWAWDDAGKMAIPVRLTDNELCKYPIDTDPDPSPLYCYADLDDDLEDRDLCREQVIWTNPGGTTLGVCKTADGRVLTGRTAATRARVKMHAYTREEDGTQSAWVVVAHEETKALGTVLDEEEDPVDIGKNVWYYTFEMTEPELAAQGMMLNQPAKDPATGDFFEPLTDEWGYEFYETEIARRASLLTQPEGKAGDSGLVAMILYKQGIIDQGGPADVMARRFVISGGGGNPYDYGNMVCGNRAYTDGTNPNYLKGVCLDHAVNLSGYSVDECSNDTAGADCVLAFPWEGGDTYPIVLTWEQSVENLDDQSWENPYDVAKGHRGFLDGDFVMAMYAWSPNWKASTIGQDIYNLYVRRSFDGGQSWTTTAGDPEPARNVSQLTGTRLTVLDPRFARTPEGINDSDYEEETRDRSRFFVAYGTGDTATVAESTAEPLDLYYSRADDYGDSYDLLDRLAYGQRSRSSEVRLAAIPDGTRLYAVWNQKDFDRRGNLIGSDAFFRRVFYDTPDE